MEMTGKQRLLCALNHQEPDTVPIFECVYSRPLFKEVLGYVPEVFDPVSVFKCSAKIGYDFVFMPIPGVTGFRPAGLTTNIYDDEWGITYKIEPATWPIDAAIKTPIHSWEDWKNYKLPDPNAEFRYSGLAEVLKMAKENGMGVVGNVRGPYSGTWSLFGIEDFSVMMYTEPELIEEALTAVTDFVIACARRMVEMGVDAVLYSDDYGSNLQPLMSVNHFRQFIVPQLKRISEETNKMGVKMLLHSDGHIKPLVDECISAGVQGLHPIERNAGMDLAEIKQKYGKQVTIFGNVDNKGTLRKGTKEDVEAMVKECIRIAAPGGGYCLSSDHSVHDAIPNENVFALYEAGRKYGKYPINL